MNNKEKKKFTIIETFVGCGGSYLGFKKAGFKDIMVNDINKLMIETLKENYKLEEEDYYIGSIENFTKDLILKKKKIDKLDLDVLCGGVVCKGFSLAGVRNPSDERNYLYLEQLRLVKELRPKVSVIENVPQFKTTKILKETEENKKSIEKLRELYKNKKSNNGKKTNQSNDIKSLEKEYDDINKNIKELENSLKNNRYSVFEHILELYKELNYTVYNKILICADYGDYTFRKRFFIVAIRNDIHNKCGEYEYPKPTHNKNGENNLPKWKTVNECFQTIDYENINNPDKDIDNKPMNHNEKTIRRFSYIPEGGSLADTKDIMPEELRTKKIFSSRGSSKRLEGNKCCPTLVPGHSAFPVHPKENRSITIREGATLTGFPINYKFFGSHTSRCEQIGNAIPVNIAYNLAISISNYLKKNLEVDKKVENRELCQFILTRGKNKGNLCNKKNCKKHKIEEKIEEI